MELSTPCGRSFSYTIRFFVTYTFSPLVYGLLFLVLIVLLLLTDMYFLVRLRNVFLLQYFVVLILVFLVLLYVHIFLVSPYYSFFVFDLPSNFHCGHTLLTIFHKTVTAMYPSTVWVFSIIKFQYQLIKFKIIPNPFCKIWIRHAVTFKVSRLSMTMLTPIGTTHCLIQVWDYDRSEFTVITPNSSLTG